MNIASKFESHTVCICRITFQTDLSRKITFKSNFGESVDFQKNANFMIFNAKNIPWTFAGHFLYQISCTGSKGL